MNGLSMKVDSKQIPEKNSYSDNSWSLSDEGRLVNNEIQRDIPDLISLVVRVHSDPTFWLNAEQERWKDLNKLQVPFLFVLGSL